MSTTCTAPAFVPWAEFLGAPTAIRNAINSLEGVMIVTLLR